MEHDSGSEKEHAHELIDKLDPAQVSTVVPRLQFVLAGPRVSLFGCGQGISQEDVLREFGLFQVDPGPD
jgi:hypothetical protein